MRVVRGQREDGRDQHSNREMLRRGVGVGVEIGVEAGVGTMTSSDSSSRCNVANFAMQSLTAHRK